VTVESREAGGWAAGLRPSRSASRSGRAAGARDEADDDALLEVAAERRVRGAVERSYRLQVARAVMDAGEMAALTLDDYRRGFAALLAALLAEFNVYLDRDGTDPIADSVSTRQFTLWLSEEELAGMRDEMLAAIRSRLGNGPSADRTKYLFTPILLPVERPARRG
jgi:hypothetical protein